MHLHTINFKQPNSVAPLIIFHCKAECLLCCIVRNRIKVPISSSAPLTILLACIVYRFADIFEMWYTTFSSWQADLNVWISVSNFSSWIGTKASLLCFNCRNVLALRSWLTKKPLRRRRCVYCTKQNNSNFI